MRSRAGGGGSGSVDAAQRKAMADAVSGVVASLISMIAFYPVDVLKTNLQSGRKEENDAYVSSTMRRRDVHHIIQRLQKLLPKLFRGLPHKFIHTMGSSFTYFYVYSFLQTKYATYMRHRACSTSGGGSKTTTSTATKLLLTAFAAVINTCITLPLDTISSRKQAGTTTTTSTTSTSKIQNENENENDDAPAASAMNGTGNIHQEQQITKNEKHQLYIKSASKYKFSFSTNLAQEAFATSTTPQQAKQQQLQSILSLWNGLFPAILLCTNPAIQYTMYDTLKNALIQYKCRIRDTSNKLSMWEAFIFGLISKFMATIITYPLIRCKVILMVSSPDTEYLEEENEMDICTSNESNDNNTHSKAIENRNGVYKQQHTTQCKTRERRDSHPKSLPLLLVHIFNSSGIRGLYKGCSLQLLHTILKSALLMMVREKISLTSYNFFQVEQEGGG